MLNPSPHNLRQPTPVTGSTFPALPKANGSGDLDGLRVSDAVLLTVQVTELLRKYLSGFQVAPIFSEEEVAHYFLPVTDVIDTYVVEGPGQHV